MGCAPKRRMNLGQGLEQTRSNLNLKIKRDRKIQKFKLELMGIECKFCARAAVELLERVPGVMLAEYVCENKRYGENNFPGYVKLYYKPREKNLQLSDVQIKQLLNSDGFDLKSIQQI